MESGIEQRMRWAPRGSGAGRSAPLASHGHPRHRYAANLPARRASFPASATDALGRVNLSAAALPLLAGGLEFMLVAAAAFEAGAAYHMIVFGSLPYATAYFVATLFLAGLYVVRSGLARVYSIKWLQDPKEQLRRVFRHWNVAFSIFVLALFLTHATDFYSRGAIIAQYAIGLAACVVVRLLLTRAATRALDSGRLKGKKVVVIGEAGLVHRSVRRLYAESRGVDIVSVITLTSNGSDAGTDDKALAEETEAALQAIQNVARRAPLDDVVISLPWSDDARIRAILEGLAAVPAAAHLAPDQLWASAGNPIPARVGRMQTIRLARAPMSLKDRILKRASDIVMASLLLVLASPVLALIALAIRLDSPGPVVFRQRRNGFNQQEFRVLKFRTMRTLDDGTVIQQARPNDRRVTRVGRILRATNLDELPQLLNVIAGDMSLVGPRPHAVAHNNEYEEKIRLYARRHNVKPGITGWAQVNGYRGRTDSIDKMRQRVEHDLYYIDHWSLIFDVRILLMTLLSPSCWRNAY